MKAIQSKQTQPMTPLDMAPAECREELNRTFTQYRYLSGMGSEASFAISIRFFIQDFRVTAEDANAALKSCRSPERMQEFKFASDLMSEFAKLVCRNRDHRQQIEQMEEQRKYRAENPDKLNRSPLATKEEIAKLASHFSNGMRC